MSDDEFLWAFERCTLPESAWTHQAHVRMAWLYLQQGCFEQVLPLVRVRIMQYNASRQKHQGYHETITYAFLHLIDHRARERPAQTFAEFSRQNSDLLQGVSVLLRHYSRDTLFSQQAREHFISPDLEPLP